MDHDNEIVEDNNDKQEQVEDQSLNNNIPDVQSNDLDLNNETENTNENTNQTSPAPPLISDEERKKQLLRSMPTPKIPPFVKSDPPCEFHDDPSTWIEWLETEVLKFKKIQEAKKEKGSLLKALESNKKIIEASSQEITFVDTKPAAEDSIIIEETKASEESSKAEEPEEPAKPVNYELSELFSEPKETAQVCEKTKADLRAKFEINQINRGRMPLSQRYGAKISEEEEKKLKRQSFPKLGFCENEDHFGLQEENQEVKEGEEGFQIPEPEKSEKPDTSEILKDHAEESENVKNPEEENKILEEDLEHPEFNGNVDPKKLVELLFGISQEDTEEFATKKGYDSAAEDEVIEEVLNESVKGGLISESFSFWLESPKKGAKSRKVLNHIIFLFYCFLHFFHNSRSIRKRLIFS